MHLSECTWDIKQLLTIYETKTIPGFDGLAEVEAFYVEPMQPVEVWDRLMEQDVPKTYFVFAEYAGLVPVYRADGRRYRRRFSNPTGPGEQVVTFASSDYLMEPVSIIFAGKRVATTGNGLGVCKYQILVCSEENRHGFPAFLRKNMEELENEERCLPPQPLEIVPPELDRMLIHA